MVELALLAGALAGDPTFLRVGEPLALSTPLEAPRWFLLEPLAEDYANPLPCPAVDRCDVPIHYAWRELIELRGRSSFDLGEVAALASPGTHRLLASDGELPSPDPALPGLREIVVRLDDSYVGYASELLGVPFVLDPTRLPDGRHQTDARLGADCVALVVYGRRRLGERIPYVAPRALYRYTDLVAGPIQRGDVLNFGFQTAILAEDRGRPGVLDAPDLVLHSYHGLAEERTMGELPYRDAPVVVLRWRDGAAN